MDKKFVIGSIFSAVLIIGAFILLQKYSAEQKAPPAKEIALEESTGTPEPSVNPKPSTSSAQIAKEQPMKRSKQLSRPEMTISQKKKYQAILHTSKGDITIDLFADKTPITVNNFVYLIKNNFYDGTIFHRIIKGFMIQGGSPDGAGSGGPGYMFDDEPFDGNYDRGIVAMANAGKNTNGSQFFIMHQNNNLPKNYVIFGKVSNGMETVDALANASVKKNAFGEESQPVTPDTIKSADIQEK